MYIGSKKYIYIGSKKLDPMILCITIGELQHNTTHCNIHLNYRSCYSATLKFFCNAMQSTLQHNATHISYDSCVALCCSVISLFCTYYCRKYPDNDT